MSSPRILVTGANGFVGRALVAELLRRGVDVTGAVRSMPADLAETPAGGRCLAVGEIGPATDWSTALAGVEIVVHLAARVHVMQDRAADPLAAFRAVNVQGTERLAQAAVAAGVRRLVFVSSVKVNGELTVPGAAFGESDAAAPEDAYGQSKWEAEQALWRIAATSGLEVAVLRPPLVYGPGVGANFLRLLRLVDSGMPLPFGAVGNRRSMVFIGNLVDAIIACGRHPAAAGRTFLVSDGAPLSTAELVRGLAVALGRAPRQWNCPPGLLNALGSALGRGKEIRRLLDSLAVDGSALERTLDWQPPFAVAEGLAQTAAWYRRRR